MPDDARGLLVYDGCCGFCERSAEWVRSKWPPSDAYAAIPWQQLGEPRLTPLGLGSRKIQCAEFQCAAVQRTTIEAVCCLAVESTVHRADTEIEQR